MYKVKAYIYKTRVTLQLVTVVACHHGLKIHFVHYV